MGKHSARRKAEEKSKNPAKIIVLAIAICLILGTASYMLYSKSRPKTVIENALTDLKKGSKETINSYLDYEQLIYSLDEMLTGEENEQISNIRKKLFDSMEWSIENIEIDGENTTAVVEVTNKDFVKVITNWMKSIINEKTKGVEITEEISLQKLQDTLTETQERKTVIKKITLNKEGKNWKIEIDENFRDLVYPGIDSVITVLNQNNK